MPNPIVGLIGASVGGGLLQSSAASKATNAQTAADAAAIEEQRRQFDAMQELVKPYVQAGEPALQGILDIAGLGGGQAQQAAITQQEQSPFFQALAAQGENALLQNASATGGLRGGNIQGALAQYRPNLLNQFIEQQYGRLGGIAQMGQNSAAGVGTAGMNVASNIGNILQNTGAAQAGGALAQGNIWGNAVGGIGGALSAPGALKMITKGF